MVSCGGAGCGERRRVRSAARQRSVRVQGFGSLLEGFEQCAHRWRGWRAWCGVDADAALGGGRDGQGAGVVPVLDGQERDEGDSDSRRDERLHEAEIAGATDHLGREAVRGGERVDRVS